jgi:hypothetical protein
VSPGLLGGPAARLLCACLHHASWRRWRGDSPAQGRITPSKIARANPER